MSDWPQKVDYLGGKVPRIEGPLKVTGVAKYTSDVQPQDWLYGMILRSKWPSAKIRSINLDKALAMPGVKAALTVRDGEREIHYYGEELAAVAGVSKQACLDALKAIEVDASPMPFVVDPVLAIKPDAPQVFADTPNVSEAKFKEEGKVDEAFGQSAVVVEGEFSTPAQLHQALETHGNTVHVHDEECMAWASTQGIFSVRDGLADYLKIPQNKVRVNCEYMGGGFGAKFGPGCEGAIAPRPTKRSS